MLSEPRPNLLIVDDDSDMRMVLVQLFEDFEISIFEAENGAAAFEIIKKYVIDCVITDLAMPGGDGVTLLKNINNLDGSRPAIFVCSGYNTLDLQTAKDLNVVKIFDKPFSPPAFIDEVSIYLKKL